jgi:hypothetical protein
MSKKNLILGGILVLLVAIAYIYQGPTRTWQEKRSDKINFFEDLNIDEVDKISVNRNGEIEILEKIGERWKIFGTKDFYVKQIFSDNIIKSLKNAKESKFELVSSNVDKKTEFVTDESGIIVKLFTNSEEVLEFTIGKMGVNYFDTYVSKKDIIETYSVESGLYSFGIEDFRDDIIFASKKDSVSKLRFQYPNREFTLEKINDEGGDLWKGSLPYEFDINQENVDKILDVMSDLSAVKIPEQSYEGTDLDKSLIIIQATGDGVDNTIMIGAQSNEDGGGFYVKRGDSDNIYLITKEQKEILDKRIEDFK